MVAIERSVLVGYSAKKMYVLVEDIGCYPEFLPWCAAADIESRDEKRTIATLHVNYRGVRQQFTTDNLNEPDSSITMKLVRGPFRNLDGLWQFTPLSQDACRIDFKLSYRFSSALLERLVGPVFHHIADSFVNAFVARAEALYAKP
jgi:ribosome-associated toxin RatA of RatAB toxin-antitoxin module